MSRFTDRRMAVNILRCGNLSLMVRKMCVPRSRMIMGQPQSMPLSEVKKLLRISMFALFVVAFVCA